MFRSMFMVMGGGGLPVAPLVLGPAGPLREEA